MTRAQSERFHYRQMDKRIIDFRVVDDSRWARIPGPSVYCVFDEAGALRYVGKHEAETPLRARWVRRGHLHHQESSRNQYLKHLDAGAGELLVCSATAREIWASLPATRSEATEVGLVKALEALWVERHFGSIWNERREPLVPGFRDGATYLMAGHSESKREA